MGDVIEEELVCEMLKLFIIFILTIQMEQHWSKESYISLTLSTLQMNVYSQWSDTKDATFTGFAKILNTSAIKSFRQMLSAPRCQEPTILYTWGGRANVCIYTLG